MEAVPRFDLAKCRFVLKNHSYVIDRNLYNRKYMGGVSGDIEWVSYYRQKV